MKMSEVFELPVEPCESFDDFYVRGCDELNLIDDQAKAAAYAINMHDELVDAVDVLLNHPYLADRDVIHDLLTRAKGGYE